MVKTNQKRPLLSYEKKKSLVGYLFLIPWAVGAIFFFIWPLFESVLYSLGELRIGKDYGVDITGFEHYIRAFTKDEKFVPMLTSSIPSTIYQVPLIVLLSLFLALLLNQKFFGRTAVRGVFFLPILIANGMILSILNGDVFSGNLMSQSSAATQLFNSEALGIYLKQLDGMSEIVNMATGFVNSIFNLLWKSGIQTLLFMTALQSIPVSMYEAAQMEGGTGWEIFWKITLPMVSPTIVLNVVYTVIDAFSDTSNAVMSYVNSYAQAGDFNYGSALIWVYTLIMLVIVGICYLVINRFVYYEV